MNFCRNLAFNVLARKYYSIRDYVTNSASDFVKGQKVRTMNHNRTNVVADVNNRRFDR